MDSDISALYAAGVIKYQLILASLPDGYFPPDEDLRADMQKIALAMFAGGVEAGAIRAAEAMRLSKLPNMAELGTGTTEEY